MFHVASRRATHAEEIDKAVHAATAWLRLLDNGQYGKSWDAASHFWKADHTREVTETVLKEQRQPRGKMLSRSVAQTEFLVVPDGDCVHIQYKSSFTNEPLAFESVDMLREENGDWKVASWSWRPAERSRPSTSK